MDIEDTHGDETISLSDVLVARDSCLPEDELWALCRECCLVLEVVNNSPEQFQTLCVTPDTVAFDQVGNVCFLDLDMDPEPIYLPPEFSKNGNPYQEELDSLSVEQAHLYSLGMTLLYAAEYNVTSNHETVSPELRDLLGRMTADNPTARPDLESTIILCEEQLCGQSSQEVCCGIAAVAGFGLPSEVTVESMYWRGVNFSNLYEVSSGDNSCTDSMKLCALDEPQSYISNISPEDQSRAESVPYSDQADITCCDDIPDLTEDVSQVDSLPASGNTSLTEHPEITADEVYDDSHSNTNNNNTSENMENRRKRRVSPQDGKSSWGMSEGKLNGFSNDLKTKPALPKKPSLNVNTKPTGADTDLRVTELASETDSEKSQVENIKNKLKSDIKHESKNSKDQVMKVSDIQVTSTDKNQNITYMKYGAGEENKVVQDCAVNNKENGSKTKEDGNTQGVKEDVGVVTDNFAAKGRRNKRKQGLTISDILEALDRPLKEEELWALCKEGTAALQRKKKHLPAYLSPDTLLIRESGNVSFKAIPEEKPLEVIFMAPELQAKGELSEKTCLYGLSVTLRCAAGKKYASVSSMNASAELKDLLTFLSDSNPNKRPELVDIAKICNEHSNGKSSDEVCAALFLEAFRSLTAKEEQVTQAKEKQQVKENHVNQPSVTPSAFKPMSGSGFQPVKQAPLTVNSGAFCPVPKKPGDINKTDISEPRIPSAFSSPSTHFKPIILHNTLTDDKKSSIKEEPSIAKDSNKSGSSNKASKSSSREKEKSVTSPDSVGNNDKEVMKKLKELKKNLMKHHHQPSMAKEIENEDNEGKGIETFKELPDKTSTPSRKSLPPTPKKSSSSRSNSGKRKTSGGALEALLKEIQKQGNVPDTQSLAAAIAQHLTSHLASSQGQGQGDAVSKGNVQTSKQPPASDQPTGELDMSVTSAQALLDQGQPLSNLNIPTQYHSQLLGHTMTLPNVPFQGNIMAGLPQFQFQQDPITGFLQLVPVNILPMRPQSVHSNSGSAHSNSGLEMQSPQLSPRVALDQSDISNVSAISDPTGLKSKAPHGRSAKGLVQKTAPMRAKNLGRPSPMHTFSAQKDQTGMYKWKSDHALDQQAGLSLRKDYVYDDSLITAAALRSPNYHELTRPHSSAYGMPPHRPIRTHSNSSSPSPSKDSGVSGMYNGGYKNYAPATDAMLMDRLLGSHSNVKQQQQEVIGKIIHLLREEFAFDGYMENGVEDVAIAEYISSLGDLKLETFSNAIEEKYSDLYWKAGFLSNLHVAVNRGHPKSANRKSYPRSKQSDELEPATMVNEDDSSSMSESSKARPRSQSKVNSKLPPFPGSGRPHSTHLGAGNKHNETSDSTDSEHTGGKRPRRPRRKHELDRIKSSSSGNIMANDGTNSASQRKIPLEHVENEHPISVNNNNITQSLSTLSPSASKPPFPPTAQPSPPMLNNKPPVYSPSYDSLKPSQSNPARSGLLQSSSQKQLAVNGRPEDQRSLSREVSMSSHSSSQSELGGHHGDVIAVEKKGHVVYHWTMIQLSMSAEMERFMHDIDEENCKLLQDKLSSLEQQIKMERRQRRQTQKFYKKLVDSGKTIVPASKPDKKSAADRNQLLQVAKNITEMTQRIVFLDLCRTHIQMLLAELQGIATSYLYSIAVCLEGEPLQLHPKPENPLLQFQNLREAHSGLEIQALHAGTPEGLMAYLFASTALSEGFLHQFLFCFRYFTTAASLLNFLISRYESATKAGSTEMNIGRLQQRVIDLLHFWLEGYFSIDFKGKQPLNDSLRTFILDQVGDDTETGHRVLSLLGNCLSGNHLELSSADPDDTEMHFWQREEPRLRQLETEKQKKEWESFKSLVRGKSNVKKKKGKVSISAVVVERRRMSAGSQENLPIMQHSRRSDMFMLTDYTIQNLAEQLCLIEQGIFQLTHPVHYLNSKFQGVGVALTMKGIRTPAPTRRSEAEENKGLFLEPLSDTSAIQKMIDHAEEVGHWVAGEIVACSNPKTQVTVLAKFLMIAHTCMQLRNYATSMSILDGLENLIVKQLPAWKHLSSKCAAIMTELSTTRMFLKNDPLSLMQQGKDCHLYPTIPSAVIFLLHIQQLEIGGFKLANQMFKWGKIRSICQVIDQVRIFREHIYGFEADHTLQDTLRQRIHEMSSQDIQTLASQHDINFQKMSSASGISGAFKKMRGKFGGK